MLYLFQKLEKLAALGKSDHILISFLFLENYFQKIRKKFSDTR